MSGSYAVTVEADPREVVVDLRAGSEGAQTALTKLDDLTTDLRALDRDLYAHDDPAEAYVVGLLLDSIRRTGEYGANVASIAVQQVAREREHLDYIPRT